MPIIPYALLELHAEILARKIKLRQKVEGPFVVPAQIRVTKKLFIKG